MRRVALGEGLMLGLGLLLAAGQVQAQVPVSVIAGPTWARISTREFSTSYRMGFFVGLGTTFRLNGRLGIEPYVTYTEKGTKFASASGEEIYNYIEIPVLLSTTVPLSRALDLGVSVGPRLSVNVRCNETYPGEPNYNCKNYGDYNGTTEFGALGRVGLRFPLGSSILAVGGGLDFGLTDVYKGHQGGWKNQAIFMFVGYGLPLGGGRSGMED